MKWQLTHECIPRVSRTSSLSVEIDFETGYSPHGSRVTSHSSGKCIRPILPLQLSIVCSGMCQRFGISSFNASSTALVPSQVHGGHSVWPNVEWLGSYRLPRAALNKVLGFLPSMVRLLSAMPTYESRRGWQCGDMNRSSQNVTSRHAPGVVR